ncbi:ATP-binding cassette domain-containing protein [Paenibacillus lentus]|uniref:ATP-binding cassette domain-containing protein n=1 Tax=Paenibacillus lentus TaxID=1338368 RepID=A0A3Q8S651_9BACL|nr:ATP-binding cassette domain-containing protein [Paenibacillus lentus]AZK48003.1 ATP-binding cassette domain-containing protein [Paenibacillus lentus]
MNRMKRLNRWNRLKITGGAIVALFIATAIIGPSLAQFAPFALEGERFTIPSRVHWLGTNSLGQDIFSGIVHGARITLFIGLAVALLSTFLSALLGLLAGYSQRLDPLLNSLANMLLVLPSLLLILIVASFTGGGMWQLIITLGLLTWPGYMRLIRASVLSLKEREFVKSAQLFGGGTFYILRKHLLPFLWPILKTKFILSFRQAVIMEASLSFIGVGDPNRPSWGKMLQQAFGTSETWMTDAWQWTVLPPTMAILLITLGLALMGEADVASASSERIVAEKAIAHKPKPVLSKKTADTPDSWASQAVIAADDLCVTYAGEVIIEPLSLSVESGTVTALIGQSGSGKTTLARALYGLLPHAAVQGSVHINGKRVYGWGQGDKSEAGIGMRRWVDAAFIFQDSSSSFNPLLTVGQQFTEAIPDLITKQEKRRIAAEALREVQLNERLLEHYPHELSGGMLSRALIALALLNKPAVLIADEPTAALDPILKREILELMVEKVREYGMTLLLITHDIPAAVHTADKIMVLHSGKMVKCLNKDEWIVWQGLVQEHKVWRFT